ncbi:MAG: 60S ribosomal protein L26, partial [Candidatus Marsarchaeota archaeon]|nr:60S ribosomal protein L26 [Candidatus Marsarchaeota archaeon]
MISSSKPRKQRWFRFNAPNHVRQKFASAHLSKELKAKL